MLEDAEDLSRFSKARELFEDDPRWRVRYILSDCTDFSQGF
jgi:hypothetical protein